MFGVRGTLPRVWSITKFPFRKLFSLVGRLRGGAVRKQYVRQWDHYELGYTAFSRRLAQTVLLVVLTTVMSTRSMGTHPDFLILWSPAPIRPLQWSARSRYFTPFVLFLNALSRTSINWECKWARVDIQTVSCCFNIAAPTVWNSLPSTLRSSQTLNTFRKHLKTHLFQSACI